MTGLCNKTLPILARLGWDSKKFAAECMLKGLGQDTAYRLVRGETNFQTQTLAMVADVLGVPSIADIIDIERADEEQ